MYYAIIISDQSVCLLSSSKGPLVLLLYEGRRYMLSTSLVAISPSAFFCPASGSYAATISVFTYSGYLYTPSPYLPSFLPTLALSFSPRTPTRTAKRTNLHGWVALKFIAHEMKKKKKSTLSSFTYFSTIGWRILPLSIA